MKDKPIYNYVIWEFIDQMSNAIQIQKEEMNAEKEPLISLFYLGQFLMLQKFVSFIKEVENNED